MDVMVKLLLFGMCFNMTYGLHTLVYDCSSGYSNVTTLPLLTVEKCKPPSLNNIKTTYRKAKLFEIYDFSETNVIQCKVKVNRTIYHCTNSFSPIEAAENNTRDYIHEVSFDTCRKMHETGLFNFNVDTELITIDNLRVNELSSRQLVFKGNFDKVDGKCHGIDYSDPYGTWRNVEVMFNVSILLEEYSATVSLEKNEILLRSGTVCKLSNENCIDMYGVGQAFWTSIPTILDSDGKINKRNYIALHDNYIAEMTDENEDFPPIYIVQNNNVVLTFIAKAKKSISGHSIVHTEHSRLIILLGATIEESKTAKTNKIFHPNIIRYMNSKSYYAPTITLMYDMKVIYQNALEFHCNVESQLFQNYLTYQSRNDLFAFHIMKVPGYTAIFSGEVVHLIQCIPVEVELKIDTNKCFSELQVQLRNKTYFMMPLTHILKSSGTQIPCSSVIPSYYFVDNKWIKFLPLPYEFQLQNSIKPMPNKMWKPVDNLDLAKKGIYNNKNAIEFVEQIAFNSDNLSQKNETITIYDTDYYQKLIKIVMWLDNGAIKYNLQILGYYGVNCVYGYIIFNVTKLIFGIAMRAYILYSEFGWSYYLFAALFSSITHVVLCNKKKHTKKQQQQQQQHETETQESIQMRDFNDKFNAYPTVYPILELEKEKLKINGSTGFQNNQAHFDDNEQIRCSPANDIQNNLSDYVTMTNIKLNHLVELPLDKIMLIRPLFNYAAFNVIDNINALENVILENKIKQCYPLPLILKTGSNSYVSLVINKSNIGILANSLGRGIKLSEQINLIIDNNDIQIFDVSVQQNNEDVLSNIFWAFYNTKQILDQIKDGNHESIKIITAIPENDEIMEKFKRLMS